MALGEAFETCGAGHRIDQDPRHRGLLGGGPSLFPIQSPLIPQVAPAPKQALQGGSTSAFTPFGWNRKAQPIFLSPPHSMLSSSVNSSLRYTPGMRFELDPWKELRFAVCRICAFADSSFAFGSGNSPQKFRSINLAEGLPSHPLHGLPPPSVTTSTSTSSSLLYRRSFPFHPTSIHPRAGSPEQAFSSVLLSPELPGPPSATILHDFRTKNKKDAFPAKSR